MPGARPRPSRPASGHTPVAPAPTPTAGRDRGVRTAQAEAENFEGVTVRVWTTLTPDQLVKNAKASWEPRTGGTVEITTLDFGDVPIKYAGVIATQDPSVDVLYTYAGFMGQFGDRIYDDITAARPATPARGCPRRSRS